MELSGLNEAQYKAVETVEGPLLILAGAGSGKTRVITYRIAHMIENLGISPYSILAITFTNKAAREMKERVCDRIGDEAEKIWISTFHSLCVRILRREIEKIGYGRSFNIYDAQDQQTLIKECIRLAGLNEDNFKSSAVISEISKAKDRLEGPEEYEKQTEGDYRLSKIASIYKLYQQKLKANNALDFDDLIFQTVRLLEEDRQTREFYQRKFRYIMVDEYQDTNHSQYRLVRLLSEYYRNLAVVGDDDQSIYGWRGADISNILSFEKDYPNTTVIKLEQNYRSTPMILGSANNVIKNNAERRLKKLWTENKTGEKIKLYRACDEKNEADYIASQIAERRKEQNRELRDFAVLYRMNAQSRAIEEALIRAGISYKIFGSLKFYDRKEIKDILSYLKLIQNPLDDIALKRIINVPKRGIGGRSLEVLEAHAQRTGESLFSALLDAHELDLSTRIKNSVFEFTRMMNELIDAKREKTTTALLEELLERTGYLEELQREDTLEARGRIENIEELKSVILDFEKREASEEEEEEKTLEGFLSSVSLMSDLDNLSETENYVTLMTLHSAKGLEFPVVFLPGMEEGLFPILRSFVSPKEIEEERRLCYVGITRAKETLYMSHASERTIYGKKSPVRVSRFIGEIGEEFFEEAAKQKSQERQSLVKRYREKYQIQSRAVDITPAGSGQSNLAVGSKIRHPKFGVGTIVSRSGTNYTIAFDGQGVKIINTEFIKLKQV
ncbi:MAG: DNA helicase PcrA [Peptostreptococcaceae bacterium]|nr:DNA helicase PcrA [Peptostreptococcaceae bacterium]